MKVNEEELAAFQAAVREEFARKEAGNTGPLGVCVYIFPMKSSQLVYQPVRCPSGYVYWRLHNHERQQ
jgi:hypothetical protein